MPTHYHLQIKVLEETRIYQYLNTVGNAYTRYFNIRYERKGPLWQSPYQAILNTTEEQVLHLSRYIHLNPTTAGIVKNPEDWEFSSYKQYITDAKILGEIMTEITIKNPSRYKKFVSDQRDYQKKLHAMKKLLLE